ncbi:MAG: SDR family NAD(P)-dependent oxidoreductase [Phycisphaera sp.]|nr:MAG: SDR family NAD(P)-dependent oxidoreductase [Phycisphaera sp.]
MKELRGKLVVVTGAASGIGLATAHALAREGCDLCLVDLDAEGLERAQTELSGSGGSVAIHTCDLGDPSAIDALCSTLLADRAPDILINNAGTLWYDPYDKMPASEWSRLMSVNLDAPARLISGLLPGMRENAGGHIVNISSMLGLVPQRNLAAYCASKHGLVGMSLVLRQELSPAIGVSVICPGLVQSNILDTAKAEGRSSTHREMPKRLAVSPDLVAKRVVSAIRGNKRFVIVTAHARLVRFAHTYAAWLIDLNQMRRNRRRQSEAPSTS